jgi:hypothetical protein
MVLSTLFAPLPVVGEMPLLPEYLNGDSQGYQGNGVTTPAVILEFDVIITPSVLNFGTAYENYTIGPGQVEPLTVNINNVGSLGMSNVTFTVTGTSGTANTAFTTTPASIASIPTGGSATFSVTPALGLAVGNHTATITIQADSDPPGWSLSEVITASFTVLPEQAITPIITYGQLLTSDWQSDPNGVLTGGNFTFQVQTQNIPAGTYNFGSVPIALARVASLTQIPISVAAAWVSGHSGTLVTDGAVGELSLNLNFGNMPPQGLQNLTLPIDLGGIGTAQFAFNLSVPLQPGTGGGGLGPARVTPTTPNGRGPGTLPPRNGNGNDCDDDCNDLPGELPDELIHGPSTIDEPEIQTRIETAVNEVTERILDVIDLPDFDPTLLALYAENAIARAASQEVDRYSLIIVNQPNVEALQGIAHEAIAQIEAIFRYKEIEINRDLRANVFFVTADFAEVNIRVEPSAMLTDVDQVWINTPYYELAFTMDFINNNAHADLYINLTATASASGGSAITTPLPLTRVASSNLDGNMLPTVPTVPTASTTPTLPPVAANGSPSGLHTYTVTFSREITEPVRVSVPPIPGDPDFQAMREANGDIMNGRYNPVTNRIDSRISRTGTYTVVENRVNFYDIQHLSAEAQRAILVMASQGIISGTAPGQFSPGNSINRVQFATLTVRKLGLRDPNANGNFYDVSVTAWYRAAAGLASRHGLMSGTGMAPTGQYIFSPYMNMPREQVVAIAARILRREMPYRDPANPFLLLQNYYVDAHTIPEWARTDISLATREDLVVRRADRQFRPTNIIDRAETALILYNLYRKIW